jgi:hypothetical protein
MDRSGRWQCGHDKRYRMYLRIERARVETGEPSRRGEISCRRVCRRRSAARVSAWHARMRSSSKLEDGGGGANLAVHHAQQGHHNHGHSRRSHLDDGTDRLDLNGGVWREHPPSARPHYRSSAIPSAIPSRTPQLTSLSTPTDGWVMGPIVERLGELSRRLTSEPWAGMASQQGGQPSSGSEGGGTGTGMPTDVEDGTVVPSSDVRDGTHAHPLLAEESLGTDQSISHVEFVVAHTVQTSASDGAVGSASSPSVQVL